MNARPSLSGARWAQRQPAETFPTVDALLSESRERKARAALWPLDLRGLRAIPQEGRVSLLLDGAPLEPTPLAASQLSQRVGLPTQAVQVLSPTLGAAALNERIAATAESRHRLDHPLRALVEPSPDGSFTLRAVTSHRYARVWDADVIEELVAPLVGDGWQPARVEGSAGSASTALFRSDRDLFCFLVHPGPEHRLPGAHGRPLQRGIVVRNSEVGGVALSARAFWFDAFCTNHMVFGGTMAFEFVVPHREARQSPLQRLREQWDAVGGTQALADQTEVAARQMQRAAAQLLAPWGETPAATARDAADAFRARALQVRAHRALPQRLIRAGARSALAYAGASEPGLSLWHLACGITQAVQQGGPHQDQRMAVDDAVGRVLAAA